jgi:hypothetical protein
MWRAMFVAVGFVVIVVGIECLAVDKVTLKLREEPSADTLSGLLDLEPKEGPPRTLVPPPWAPYSLLAVGMVTCLYSFTIPRRVSGG